MRKIQKGLLLLKCIQSGVQRRLRSLYYRNLLNSMGKGCQICSGVLIFGHELLTLGDKVYINDGVILQCCEGAEITIGDNVVLSYGAKILTGGLDLCGNATDIDKHLALPIVLKKASWIGAGAIILPGVTIGEGGVVAAGSVVTRDVDPQTVVAGSPAKNIRVLG